MVRIVGVWVKASSLREVLQHDRHENRPCLFADIFSQYEGIRDVLVVVGGFLTLRKLDKLTHPLLSLRILGVLGRQLSTHYELRP